MKRIKIVVAILALLLVLFVVAVLIVGMHLGDIVKAGLETAGPRIMQTTLTVDAVNISLLNGSAAVKGLVLGNPDGFKAPQSISISNAAISLVPGSVLSDKIVIRSVEVSGPEITFEGNPFGANNLSKIMDNVKAATGSTAKTGGGAPTAPAGPAKPAKRFEVDDFLIAGAVVHANLTGLMKQEITLPIPDIHFTDLGKGTDGITAAELTQKILSEITTSTLKTLASSASKLGKNAALDASGLTQSNTLNKLKKGLNGLLGK